MIKHGRLPAGLQEVEWLRQPDAPWLQHEDTYIDTGYYADNETSVYYRQVHTTNNMAGSNAKFFGAGAQHNVWYGRLTGKPFVVHIADAYIMPIIGNYYERERFARPATVTDSLVEIWASTTQFKMMWDENEDYKTEWNFPSSLTQTPTCSIALFAVQWSENGEMGRDFGLEWYNVVTFEIYKAGVAQRKFIPCYTTSAGWRNELGNVVPIGTKGMYDQVNGILYTNRGTGADFIAGPDV